MTDKDETIHDLQGALLETVGSLALLNLDKAPGVPEIIKSIKATRALRAHEGGGYEKGLGLCAGRSGARDQEDRREDAQEACETGVRKRARTEA